MSGQAEAARRRASAVIPSGMTSAARAGVRPGPLHVSRAEGAYLFDVDGRPLVDFALANGPLLLGHTPGPVVDAVERQLRSGVMYGAQHALEAQVAEMLVEMVPCAEGAIFNTTGSEAVHSALRLSRAVTGRRLVARFEGHYHGWLNDIAFAGPGAPPAPLDAPVPLSAPAFTGGMLPPQGLAVLRWNDLPSLEQFFVDHGEELAALILEPLPMAGLIAPAPGYLERLRQLTAMSGALLVFDEVVTGFRLGGGGAQGRFGVSPDLAILGKALGAGFPVSAVVGHADVLGAAGDGRMAQMGTFNGHPPSLAAAAAALDVYRDDALHEELARRTERLADGLLEAAAAAGISLRVPRSGALAATVFADPEVPIGSIAELAAAADFDLLGNFAAALLDKGVFIPPRGTWMLSAAHGDREVDLALEVAQVVLAGLVGAGG